MAEIDGGYIRIHIVDTGDSNNITLTLHPNYIVENSPANAVVGKLENKGIVFSSHRVSI